MKRSVPNTVLQQVGDFVLLVTNAMWLTVESQPRGLRALLKCLCHSLVRCTCAVHMR